DAVWMGLGHGVGWVVRAVGRKAATARDLEPEHRRDGLGLLMIGLAILLAVAVWFDRAGQVGGWIAQATRFVLGAVAAVLPVLLVGGAVRLMRQPPDPEHPGRGLAGWTALLVG